MNDYGLIVTIPDFNQLDGKKAMAILHDHAREIADPILDRIEDRTVRDTGALYEDETYKLGDGSLLVSWFTGDTNQFSEWGRVYVAYQEGPPLGLDTYTNIPHQMFFRVSTEDLDLITDWAQNLVDQAADSMAEAAEAGATEWQM